MQKDWYKQALCKIHLDMHCPEWHDSIFENFSAKDIVTRARNTGAESLYFFAKDCYGNAYYNTKVGHKHRCIGDRDLLAEVLEEAQKQSYPIMAYYVIWDLYAAKTHPEWCMKDPDGRDVSDATSMEYCKWKYLCHNSGYAEYSRQMIDEISSQYPIAGFHIDMFNMDFGGLSCYCDSCKTLFKQQTGKDLPTEPGTNETWRQFLEFRYQSVENIANLLRDAALKNKPDIPVVMNYHGSPNFDWRAAQKPVRHSLFSDLGTGETYTPMLGDMYPGMEARFLRNLVPDKPFEMVAWRMNRITDFTVKPKHQLRWETFISIANGATAMFIDQPFHDGTLDPVAYDRMEEVFTEIKEKKGYFGGRPLKQTAIFYSCKSRDYYGLTNQEKFLLPVMGAYKALVESHFYVDFLFDETVTQEMINEYSVVFLPNVAVLDEKEQELLKAYVKQGGVLVSTFDTGRYSATGDLLDNFSLNELFGVDYEDTVDCDTNYIRNLPSEYGVDIDPRYHILNVGPIHRVQATSAKAIGDLHDSFFKQKVPEQFFSHNVHPPYKRLTDAMYVNQYGKGFSVYLPHGCDASYANTYELPEHRIIIRNIVKAHCKPAEVELVKAPMNVEVAVNQQDGKLQVHLISFNPNRQSTTLPSLNKPIRPSIRMEEPCIYKAQIKVNIPFKSITNLNPSTQIQVEGNVVNLICDDIHEVLTINV